MRLNSYLLLLISFLLFFTPFRIFSQDNVALEFSGLGTIIEPKENLKYNIFGDIEGFSAAKLYLKKNLFFFHIIRNTDSSAQVLIINKNDIRISEFNKELQKRVSNYDNDNNFPDALIETNRAEWDNRAGLLKLILSDLSELNGKFVRADKDLLFFNTISRLSIEIPDKHIHDIEKIEYDVDSKIVQTDPNVSRLFFGPTGRGLNAGSGYFADYFIFFPQFAWGFTDNLSLAVGTSLIPTGTKQLLTVAPKISIPVSETVGLGIGYLHVTVPGASDNLNLGYAVATIGTKRKALTVGGGINFQSGGKKDPVLMIGGEYQVSNRAKFITENWFFPGSDMSALYSFGARFFGKSLSADFALMTTSEMLKSNGLPFFPWVSFTAMFGNY